MMIPIPAYAESEKVSLHIEGMVWASWPLIIKKALEGLEGVEKAKVSFEEKRGEVTYNPKKVGTTDIIKKVKEVGFMAKILEEEGGQWTVDNLICYCFGYTDEDIKQDFLANGRSVIMEKIAEAKRAAGCDCANKNPTGTWCLPDVRRVVDEVTRQTINP